MVTDQGLSSLSFFFVEGLRIKTPVRRPITKSITISTETGHGIVQKNICTSQLDEFCTENTTSKSTNMTENISFLFIVKLVLESYKSKKIYPLLQIVDINHLKIDKWMKKIIIFTKLFN